MTIYSMTFTVLFAFGLGVSAWGQITVKPLVPNYTAKLAPDGYKELMVTSGLRSSVIKIAEETAFTLPDDVWVTKGQATENKTRAVFLLHRTEPKTRIGFWYWGTLIVETSDSGSWNFRLAWVASDIAREQNQRVDLMEVIDVAGFPVVTLHVGRSLLEGGRVTYENEKWHVSEYAPKASRK